MSEWVWRSSDGAKREIGYSTFLVNPPNLNPPISNRFLSQSWGIWVELACKNWNYVRRIDPGTCRRRHKRNIGYWFRAIEIDLKRLLKHRGGKDTIIETYLRCPELVFRGTGASIGEELDLTLVERVAAGITSIRPCDVPWRDCRRFYKLERNRRKRERAALKRARAGIRPISESLSRTKPWAAEGVSRATWYRRRKAGETTVCHPLPTEEVRDDCCLTAPNQRFGPAMEPSPTIAKPLCQPQSGSQMKELYDYQADAIENLRATLRQGVRKVVLQAPTGSGKTRIAAEITQLGRQKGSRVAFVVPAISLVDQTVESFYAEGIRDIGVIQANHEMTDWSRPVQICSVQTIQARKTFPDCQIAIFDECHRLFEAHKRWMLDEAWQGRPFIGLSATPWAKGLGKYFQTLLKVASVQELIDCGRLSRFRVFATGHPDLGGVRTVAGDYHEGELSAAMQAGSLVADIVKTYQAKWGKGKTLCFGVDKAHAKTLQERFEAAGIRCGYQDADTPADERREIRRKFHSGEYEVVCNIQTLTTGVNWDVRCLILARPTKSEMLFVQIIGRALRTAPGKDEALILDHSDTTARLGFVTEIDHDDLDDGRPASKTKQERKEPLPKECEACAFLMPRSSRKCPNCGHEIKITSSIFEADGELQEIVPGQLLKVGRKTVWSDPEKRVFLAELKGYAVEHGYKPGWAANKYREKFGEWPDKSMDRIEPAKMFSPTTVSWVRSGFIRWAKSKANPENAAP